PTITENFPSSTLASSWPTARVLTLPSHTSGVPGGEPAGGGTVRQNHDVGRNDASQFDRIGCRVARRAPDWKMPGATDASTPATVSSIGDAFQGLPDSKFDTSKKPPTRALPG